MLPRRARTTKLCALLIWKLNGNSEKRHSTSAQHVQQAMNEMGDGIRQKQQENRFIWESALRRKLNDSPGEWATATEGERRGENYRSKPHLSLFFHLHLLRLPFLLQFVFFHFAFIQTEMINVWHKMDAWISSTVNSHLITSPLTVQIDGEGNAKRNQEWFRSKGKTNLNEKWVKIDILCKCVYVCALCMALITADCRSGGCTWVLAANTRIAYSIAFAHYYYCSHRNDVANEEEPFHFVWLHCHSQTRIGV